jgi:cell division protein FtsI (penicillin-binding protein 3)
VSTIETLPKVKYGSTQDMGVVMDGVGVRYENKVPNDNWGVAIKNENKVSIEKRKIDKTKVPNLVGMPLNDAVVLAENFGLRIKVEGSGVVVSQSLAAGSGLINGTQIKIVLK